VGRANRAVESAPAINQRRFVNVEIIIVFPVKKFGIFTA